MTSKDKAHEPHIYPAHCHIESPTLGAWCPILACDIHKLVQVEGFEGKPVSMKSLVIKAEDMYRPEHIFLQKPSDKMGQADRRGCLHRSICDALDLNAR